MTKIINKLLVNIDQESYLEILAREFIKISVEIINMM